MTQKKTERPDFRQEAERYAEVLRSVWEYPSFRPSQRQALAFIAAGRDTLAVLPTGGGKSLLFQVPALARPGLAVVVSPLIALMEDQVARLKRQGVASAALSGPMAPRQAEQLLVNAQHGAYKLLYLAPERLQSELFAAYAPKLDVSLLAVDEAHCVSEWSRSFRPAYREIPAARALLGNPQLLAVTATATPEVRRDIVELLKLDRPSVLVTGFRRDNLALHVERSDRKALRVRELLRASQGAAIVYVSTRRSAEQMGQALERADIASAMYHGGLGKAARMRATKRWMEGDARVMVATNAFGMGIDRSDVRLVIHAEAPASLEAYYQEAGRAGRDGAPARAHLLWQPRDLDTHARLAEAAHPTAKLAARVFDCAAEIAQVPLGDLPEEPLSVHIAAVCKALQVLPATVTGALQVLERQGALRIVSGDGDGLARWLVPMERVRAQAGSEALRKFVDALARRLSADAFHRSVPVRLESLGRSLGMEPERVARGLAFLSQRGVLDYHSFEDRPWVQLLVPRTRRLPLDLSELERSKRMLDRRREAMALFLGSPLCRMQFVLGYFGDSTFETCGRCDVCASASVGDRERRAVYLLSEAASGEGARPSGDAEVWALLQREGLVEVREPAGGVWATPKGEAWLRRRQSASEGRGRLDGSGRRVDQADEVG
jgi:ATP-dependent DNA helicase RecQ